MSACRPICQKMFVQGVTDAGGATWSVWFKIDSLGQQIRLFLFASNGSWGTNVLSLSYLTNHTIYMSQGAFSVGVSPVMSDVPLGQWHLLVVTWDKNDQLARCYVNDVLRATTNIPTVFSPGNTSSYAIQGGYTFPNICSWDELTVWTSTRFSAAQRTALYNSGAGAQYPTYPAGIPAPTACWKFNSSITDSVLGITMSNFPSAWDYQAGKFGNAVHKTLTPASFNLSSGAQAGLKIP